MKELFTKLHDALDNFFVRWEVFTGLSTKGYLVGKYRFNVNWPIAVFALGAIGVLMLCVGLFGGWGLLVFLAALYGVDRYVR